MMPSLVSNVVQVDVFGRCRTSSNVHFHRFDHRQADGNGLDTLDTHDESPGKKSGAAAPLLIK